MEKKSTAIQKRFWGIALAFNLLPLTKRCLPTDQFPIHEFHDDKIADVGFYFVACGGGDRLAIAEG
jgi:hypothetical protein